MNEIKNITILGAGAFGFAIAKILGDNENKLNYNVSIYDPNEKLVEQLKKTRRHIYFHSGIELSKSVKIIDTENVNSEIKKSDLIILAIPSKFMKSAIVEYSNNFKENVTLLSLAKGFDPNTGMRISEMIKGVLNPKKIKYNFAILSGGMIASEVAKKKFTAADIATDNIDIAGKIQELFNLKYFTTNITTDIIGVELSGILKNIIAIGAGFFDGANYDTSSKSAFVSIAARRAKKLAVNLGAKKQTFELGSYAFLGDILTTCFGNTRNREFGELIGEGKTTKLAVDIMNKNKRTVEGLHSLEILIRIINENNENCPLIRKIHDVVEEKISVSEFLSDFS